jgi:hypothetical protein
LSDKAPHFRGIAHQPFCCRINLSTVRFVLLGLDLTYRVEDKQFGDASGACEASIFGDFQEGEESLPEPNNRAVPDSLL